MDCLLRVIQGPEGGQTHRIEAGETLLGKAGRAQVRFSGEGVSFEHAIITRTGDEYTIENLSAHGTFVNDGKISGKTKLHLADTIRLSGEAVLKFEAADGSAMTFLARRRVLATFGVVIALVVGVLVVFDPFAGKPEPADDWDKAYGVLATWLEGQAKERAVPGEALALLRDARRLENAGDKREAGKRWMQLRLLFVGQEEKLGLQQASDREENKEGKALRRLLKGSETQPGVTDEEAKAALWQYIERRRRAASN